MPIAAVEGVKLLIMPTTIHRRTFTLFLQSIGQLSTLRPLLSHEANYPGRNYGPS
jgi:hypothetical protein